MAHPGLVSVIVKTGYWLETYRTDQLIIFNGLEERT